LVTATTMKRIAMQGSVGGCARSVASVSTLWDGAAGVRGLHVNLQGGRSSVSGVVATVFGCTGFLGRFVVNRLGKIGSQVVVPYRGEESAFRHLKVMGDLGQIAPVWFDLRDKDTVRRAVQHSNVVINLLGKRWETRNFSFNDVHPEATRTIAQAAKEAGVERFIQVSAANADPNSPSAFARSKGESEQVLRDIFPDATILRPTVLYGARDHFLVKWGMMARYWPVFARTLKDTKFQPLYVADMATALLNALADPETAGKTYELGGPKVYTQEEITEMVSRMTFLEPTMVDVPFPLVRAFAKATQTFLRKPRYTVEELDYWRAGDVVVPEQAPLTIKDLRLPLEELTVLEKEAVNFLRLYRKPATMNLILEDQLDAKKPNVTQRA
jgi:NADH dehydrogenase (ubiquinone) 1 alpha subcomplex subunit 9